MENASIKNERIKYLILGLAYFLSIPLANIVLVFKPLYNKVYYGQANDIFYYGLSVIVLGVLLILVELLLKPKLGIKLIKSKEELPIINTILIFSITFIAIFIISAILGFHLKPFYDLGKNTTGFKIIVKAVEILYLVMISAYMVKLIEAFQYTLDNIIPFKKEIINKYFPYGGIATMLTFGIYMIILNFTSLSLLFFFLIIVFGEIYLLAERNFIKAFGSIALIFIF
ncbi:MAG: hypothetical protein ACI35W_06815 [Anaeroplasmataceae bacterium]